MPKKPKSKLTDQEWALVLASLRLWQQVSAQCGGDMPEDLLDIAGSPDEVDIDALCERINLGEAP